MFELLPSNVGRGMEGRPSARDDRHPRQVVSGNQAVGALTWMDAGQTGEPHVWHLSSNTHRCRSQCVVNAKRISKKARSHYRQHPLEFKRALVALSLEPGASVARIAREHGVNANQVFSWRRLYQQGRLGVPALMRADGLLPGAGAVGAST